MRVSYDELFSVLQQHPTLGVGGFLSPFDVKKTLPRNTPASEVHRVYLEQIETGRVDLLSALESVQVSVNYLRTCTPHHRQGMVSHTVAAELCIATGQRNYYVQVSNGAVIAATLLLKTPSVVRGRNLFIKAVPTQATYTCDILEFVGYVEYA